MIRSIGDILSSTPNFFSVMKRAVHRSAIVRIHRVPKTMQTATTLGAMEPGGTGRRADEDDILVESKIRRMTTRTGHAITKSKSGYAATPRGLR